MYRPFLGKQIVDLTRLKSQEVKDRQSLRFCGQPDILRNDRPVVAPQSGVATLIEYPYPSP